MEDAVGIVVELAESVWQGFRRDLQDVTPAEAAWRPLPEANSIGLVVRHLAIEVGWHRAAIERGEPIPSELTEEQQRQVDRLPLDFDANLRTLDEAFLGFLAALRSSTVATLRERTRAAYKAFEEPASPHQLALHPVHHLARHWGQIRTIRNLYRKTRGEPARFFPNNPSFPRGDG